MTTPQKPQTADDSTNEEQGSNCFDRLLISLGFKEDPKLAFLECQRTQFTNLFSKKAPIELDAVQLYEKIAQISSAIATRQDTFAKNRLTAVGLALTAVGVVLSTAGLFIGYQNMLANQSRSSADPRRAHQQGAPLQAEQKATLQGITITVDQTGVNLRIKHNRKDN